MNRAVDRNRLAVQYRLPEVSDGAEIWRLVRDSGKLDLNSPYYYLAMTRWFSESCRVAVDPSSGYLVGMVIGFQQPSHPDTLFIWQIAVDKRYQGKGIARTLLDDISRQREIRYLEATISPSNRSSLRLFTGWASSKGSAIKISSGFEEKCFPEGKHEREDLYRIGPLKEDDYVKEVFSNDE
ncbi:diaminobutyrate acetyltransferase [Paenibacillus mendelii]|uniref:L-2,4-diaminobutyric acid acetyltransferase n=1 Tax=Paenibacillus mendelii TaxID=206163 RepID=A0ABV6J1Y3_9BACL|nr:diaminobutyrate acetyltransferase [Paenibacillus mendelii]MCQ6562820.1 diaminobutyrate acetyltransferase [Paenibacillus mendelii]